MENNAEVQDDSPSHNKFNFCIQEGVGDNSAFSVTAALDHPFIFISKL